VIVVDKTAEQLYSYLVDAIYAAFSHNLRSWRTARSLSQGDLGERSGIGRATIASIEGGRQAVLLHQAVALAAALDVPLTKLIDTPLGDLEEELRGSVSEDDLQKILDLTKGLP
jgi:transcriptional regulator with XRE-family HTH domain